jgi:hypothetical protein
MFGVAEVGVGYAVLPPKFEVVLSCGVAVGGVKALGMPKFCSDELPVIGVGVECL